MTRGWLAALWLLAAPAFSAPIEALKLVSEHPVEGMVGGNLSGLAMCSGRLWTVSDRDDKVLYKLDTAQKVWTAEAQEFDAPTPQSDLPLNLRSLATMSSVVRGGSMDFEGISCDAAGNRYVVSEAFGTVLKVPANGPATWLKLPAELVTQARDKGMLHHFNGIFEGIAVNPAGDQLWLAAERDKRGLLTVRRQDGQWGCDPTCVLLAEPESGATADGNQSVNRDYADLSLYNGKLFTLERSVYRVCRRTLETGKLERCWSFRDEARLPSRRYDQAYGLTEALVVDETGAWIGTDNNFGARADGEKRPVVWRFAAPKAGWSAP